MSDFKTVWEPRWPAENKAVTIIKFHNIFIFRINYDNGNSFPQQMVCDVLLEDGTWKRVGHVRDIDYDKTAAYYCKNAEAFRKDFDGYLEAWKAYISTVYGSLLCLPEPAFSLKR